MPYLKMRFADDSGSAALEFVAFGLIASLGIMFATLELQALQSRQFISQQFSKQIARSLVVNANQVKVADLTESLLHSYRLTKGEVIVSIMCQPACASVETIEPGSVIEVHATYEGQTAITRMRSAR